MPPRWKFLKNQVIAHKCEDGWKIGKVWKKGTGVRYGGMLWVNYGADTGRGGHEFDPKDYGVDSDWVILTPEKSKSRSK